MYTLLICARDRHYTELHPKFEEAAAEAHKRAAEGQTIAFIYDQSGLRFKVGEITA